MTEPLSFDDYYLACASTLAPPDAGDDQPTVPWSLGRAYELLVQLGLKDLAGRAWFSIHRTRTGFYAGDAGRYQVTPLAKWFGYVAEHWPAPAETTA